MGEQEQHQMQVVVVVNGPLTNVDSQSSEISLQSLQRSMQDAGIASGRVVHESQQSLLAGRHRGVVETDGEYIAFLDDDVTLSAGWLDGVHDCVSSHNADLITGPCLAAFEKTPPKWINKFVHGDTESLSKLGSDALCSSLSIVSLGNSIRDIGWESVWGLNFIIRRKTLLEVGGFRPDGVSWDDRWTRGDGEVAVAYNAHQLGAKLLYHPDAAVRHHIAGSRVTADYFCKRAYLQGISDSYSRLRKMEYAPQPDETDSTAVGSLRTVYRRFRNFIQGDAVRLQNRVQIQYQKGFNDHQETCRNDADLMAWVKLENYWDHWSFESFRKSL